MQLFVLFFWLMDYKVTNHLQMLEHEGSNPQLFIIRPWVLIIMGLLFHGNLTYLSL